MGTMQDKRTMQGKIGRVAVAKPPMMDRLFVGGGAALFAVLMGVVAQATWLYWR